MLGGSLPHPELEAVMTMAGRHFVSIPELEVAAGKRIAEKRRSCRMGTALVTLGAAVAYSTRIGGHLKEGMETLIRQLPGSTGMKSEAIIRDRIALRLITSCGRRNQADRDRTGRSTASGSE